jgi:hypothetical protein
MWHNTNEDSHARGEEEGGVHDLCVAGTSFKLSCKKKINKKVFHVTWMMQCNNMIWFSVAKLVAARLVVVPIRCSERVINKR